MLGFYLAGIAEAETNVPGGGNAGPAVTVARQRSYATLANGIITAVIDTVSAKVISLRYQGHEMVSQTGRHKTIYFFVVGDRNYEIASPCVYSVKRQTPDMVDISCKRVYSRQNPKQHPWDIDTHFVLRRGASGLYVYTIVNHWTDYPALDIGQYLMIWSMPELGGQWLLEKIYVDEARHWELPSPDDFTRCEPTGIQEIVRLTTGPWKGQYDCKYMYTASYRDLGCWGFASDRNHIGAWVIFGSHEFFNNGPTMSDLTSASGIFQVMFNMNHYGGSGIAIPKGEVWQKVFGPYLLYCNSSPNGGDACWADAKRQAQAEQAAWPYAWLTDNSLYPLKTERGMVTGRFVVRDTLKPNVSGAGAWVGVTRPDPGVNWQLDSKHYQYWVQADAAGNFSIPNVRPGIYVLYAFVTGAVGEFSQTNVTVKAGETTALGDVVWKVPHSGASLAWEIGVPDRTAREFRHGNDYFQPYLWEKFAGEFSNPLEYTVGASNWSKDWNYVQCGYPRGEKWSPWKWRIHFNLPVVPAGGNATLTLAYASSYYGRTEVYLNDEGKMFKLIRPAVDGGNALIREGIHAKYCVEQVPIPVSLLRTGTNTITLVQGENRYDRPFYHVMYDYLSLELPAAPQ
jgi:rhamnogalacturonan endolyase